MKRKSLIIFLVMLIGMMPVCGADTIDGQEYNLNFTKNADTIATLDCTDGDGNKYAENAENWFGGIEESYGGGLFSNRFGGLSRDMLGDSETAEFTKYYLDSDGTTLISDTGNKYKMDFYKAGYGTNVPDAYVLSTISLKDGTIPSSLTTPLNAVSTESVRFAVNIQAGNAITAKVIYDDDTYDEDSISVTGWASMYYGDRTKYFSKLDDPKLLRLAGVWWSGYRTVVPNTASVATVKEPSTGVSMSSNNDTLGAVLYEMKTDPTKVPKEITISVKDKYPVILYSMKQCEIKNETLMKTVKEAEAILDADNLTAENMDKVLLANSYADILEQRNYSYSFAKVRGFAYTAVPSNGAVNLYDIDEITFNWKDMFDISGVTVDVKCGEESLNAGEYTPNVTGNELKIEFAQPLAGEKTYTVTFGGVKDSGGNLVSVPKYTVKTGGVYKAISLESDNNIIEVGSSAQLTVQGITESDAKIAISNNDIVFTSDNPEVIEVSADGVVTANKKGSAVITAEFTDKVENNPNADENNKFYTQMEFTAYPPISSVTGSREDVTLRFNEEVVPLEVYFTDTETSEKIKADFTYTDKELYATPDKLLDLAKKYFLTVVTEDWTYDKTVSFDVLVNEDFKNPEAYKDFSQGRWSGDADGKKFTDLNAENTAGNLILGQGKDVGSAEPALGYKVDADSKEWKDYTVEFKYLTNESGYTAKNFAFYMLSQNTTSMCIAYDLKQAVTVGTGDGYTRYRDNTAKQELHVISDEVIVADKTKFTGNDLRVSGTMMGKDLSVRVRTAGNEELVYLKKAYLPTEIQNLYKTSGSFGIYASATGALETDTFYIDDIICYKTNYGDVEYTASIPFNARDVYDVTEVEFQWHYNIAGVSKANVIITEDGSPYSNFEVIHSGNITRISFNNTLASEKTYKISFTGLEINPAPLSFFMGGIYETAVIGSERFVKAGEKTPVYMTGKTEQGNSYTLVNDYVSYSLTNGDVFEINADGELVSKDRGYSPLKAEYNDPNTANTNGNGGTNVFTDEALVYSYISKEALTVDSSYKKVADFAMRDGVLKIKGTDIKIGFDLANPLFSINGDIEVLKYDNLVSVYNGGVKLASDVDATGLTELYISAGACTEATLYNLIGNVCTADFVNVRNDSEGIKCEYAYEDKDKDAEEGTQFIWYSSSEQDGTYTPVSGQNGKYFTAIGYEGKYLKAEVIPKNKYEEGKAVMSGGAYYVPTASTGGGSTGGGGGSRPSGGVSIGGSVASGSTVGNITAVAYKDVNDTHWAFSAISTLTESGVLKGFTDGTFLPEKSVTRAEFVCALIKLKKDATAQYTGIFADVAEGDWFAPYVQKAYDKKYITGDGENFYPNAPITREEMAVIIYRAFKISGKTELTFDDSHLISDWAYDAVCALVKNEILNGMGNNKFEPKSNTTRAQMAALLSRLAD